jgi:hypothetical protein
MRFALGVVQCLARLTQAGFVLWPFGARGFQVFGQPLGALLFGFQRNLLLFQGGLIVLGQASLSCSCIKRSSRAFSCSMMRSACARLASSSLRSARAGSFRAAARQRRSVPRADVFRLGQGFAGLRGTFGKDFRLLLGRSSSSRRCSPSSSAPPVARLRV